MLSVRLGRGSLLEVTGEDASPGGLMTMGVTGCQQGLLPVQSMAVCWLVG